jgi:putative DNA primase/helicase
MSYTEKAIGDRILSRKDLGQHSADPHHEQLAPEIARSASVEFEAAMAAGGLQVPLGGVKADGQIHRCDVVGKDGEGEGSYQLQLDDIPAGWFQNHRDSARPRRWHARTGQKHTTAELAAFKEKVRLQNASREADLAQQQEQTAKRAAALIEDSKDAPASHPYLVKNKVQAHGLRYSAQPVAISPSCDSAADVLVVPMRDIDGTLWNAQFIEAAGATEFLKPGRTSGCFFVIGKKGANFARSGLNPVGLNLICEEFATSAACFEALDVPAVVAFGYDNLLPVAQALHAAYPKAKFIICGDDDWKAQDPDGKPINPGRTHALKAARATRAEVAFPVFSPGYCRSDSESNFNDLALAEGPGSVRACIEAAEAVETIETRAQEPANAAIEAAVERLAALSDADYEFVREDEAKKLGFSLTFLDKVVRQTKAANAPSPTDPAKQFSSVEPWPQAVDGKALLSELVTTILAYVVLEESDAIAMALWILHAHAHDAATISAILAIISPQPRCGKTTLGNLLKELTPNPLLASNISAAALFRSIEAAQPTLIVDEADTFLAKNDERRGILNSGHNRRAAFVYRAEKVGKKLTPVQYSTWAPKAIASIENLPRTLQDRSIAIRLRRKLPSEKVRNFRADRVQALTNLCRMAARWAQDNLDTLRNLDASVPGQLHDRQADNWRPLFNIADRIGGEWPAKARAAALTIEGAESECEKASPTSGIRLLADCRTVFEDEGATEPSAKEIIARLYALDESPWRDYKWGKPITESAFAALLEPFGIKSKRQKSGKDKGRMKWRRSDFEDAWRRYL